MCLIGEYIHAALPLCHMPGLGLAGKRNTIKTTDEKEMADIIKIFTDPETAAFMTHITPGVLAVTPSGYIGITIGLKEAVSTMDP
jgi:hypothetical protein